MYDLENLEETHDEWAVRSEYWLQSIRQHTPKRKRRERQATPLILSGHGISIAVEKGTLAVKDGNTHYPSEIRKYRFFKGDLGLPKRIFLIDGSGNITLDALDWLSTQNVELIRLNWNGKPIIALGNGKSSVLPEKLMWQFETQSEESKRLDFAIPLISAKAEATLHNLLELLPDSPSKTKAINTTQSVIELLQKGVLSSIGGLLSEEGRVAAGYFFSWRALKIHWRAEGRYPIQHEWKRFFSRSTLSSGKPKNYNATHPVNAMLNYAYRMLEAHVRIGVIADGYDVSQGILHNRVDPRRHSFVFDMMEPLRPIVDRAVLKLVQDEIFTGADFILQDDGVCRLSPNLARKVVYEVEFELRNSARPYAGHMVGMRTQPTMLGLPI